MKIVYTDRSITGDAIFSLWQCMMKCLMLVEKELNFHYLSQNKYNNHINWRLIRIAVGFVCTHWIFHKFCEFESLDIVGSLRDHGFLVFFLWVRCFIFFRHIWFFHNIFSLGTHKTRVSNRRINNAATGRIRRKISQIDGDAKFVSHQQFNSCFRQVLPLPVNTPSSVLDPGSLRNCLFSVSASLTLVGISRSVSVRLWQ